MKRNSAIILFLAVAMLLATAAYGQEQPKKMRQEVIKLRYLDTEEIRLVLSGFLSPWGRISPTERSGLLTVSDTPENVEKILAVVRELDVKPADMQFTVQLVLASTTDEPGRSEDLIKDDPLVKELRGLLNFKYFYPLDSSYIRALDREESQVTLGEKADLMLQLRPKYVQEEKEGLIQVETRLYKIVPIVYAPGATETRNPYSSLTLLSSNFTMKSGDKTVVGVSKLDGGDKGLILIITGKVVR
jgi:hypothetical protein